jgi:hypothetical protein
MAVDAAACRTLAKPYCKQSSADELKLQCIIGGLLHTLTAVLQPGMPQQLQECTADVCSWALLCHNHALLLLLLLREVPVMLRMYSSSKATLHYLQQAPCSKCQQVGCMLSQPQCNKVYDTT